MYWYSFCFLDFCGYAEDQATRLTRVRVFLSVKDEYVICNLIFDEHRLIQINLIFDAYQTII